MTERLVKMMTRDYVVFMPRPDAPASMRNLVIAFEHHNEQHPHGELNTVCHVSSGTGRNHQLKRSGKWCPEIRGQSSGDAVSRGEWDISDVVPGQ